ncbi:transmembrane protein 42 isoform X1 [Hyla sarda]|uniref:transmembrane protein 42 isoform X1 n=1 Tax=Hyla sarda TaxID=327740 RepID=UPI0024C4360B|nr:transmembrane protein 42 isoform X1 [Hyla sarda]
MWSSWGCSAVAGLLGALSASSAKCALGADYLRSLCEVAVGERADICEGVHLILRLGCAGLVFLCNAIMWTFFAKALRYSSSTAAATVTTTASNFVSSAVLGKILFGESRALLWWVGISITICGLVLLHTSSSQTEDTTKKKS